MSSSSSTYSLPHLDLAEMMAQSFMLAIEAQEVIAMRLTKMFMGGPDVQDEAHLMVSEKLAAMVEGSEVMVRAAMVGTHNLGADQVIQLYRRKVTANHRRLSARA
jgi:hypothetical protein